MVQKQALSRITDSIGHAPKPNVEAYQEDQDMIDDAEEKKAEERLAQAKKKVRRNSKQTLSLLAEVQGMRQQSGLAPSE